MPLPNLGGAALQRVVQFLGHQVAEPDRGRRLLAEAEAASEEAARLAIAAKAEFERAAAERDDDERKATQAERVRAYLEVEAVRKARAEVAASVEARFAAELRTKLRASREASLRLQLKFHDAEDEAKRRACALVISQRAVSTGLVSGDWKQRVVKVSITELLQLIEAADYMEADDLLDLACTAVANLVASKPTRDVHGVFIPAALAQGKRKAGEAAPTAAGVGAWPPALPAEAMSCQWDDAQPYSTAAVKEGLSMAAQDCPDPSASSALRIARDWRAPTHSRHPPFLICSQPEGRAPPRAPSAGFLPAGRLERMELRRVARRRAEVSGMLLLRGESGVTVVRPAAPGGLGDAAVFTHKGANRGIELGDGCILIQERLTRGLQIKEIATGRLVSTINTGAYGISATAVHAGFAITAHEGSGSQNVDSD